MTSMDSSVSFYRQIKGRILFIAFLFSCLCIGLVAAFYHSESALFSVKRQTLPTIAQQANNYKLMVESEQLLTKILIADNPQGFYEGLLNYQKNLQVLNKSNAIEKLLLRRLLTEIEPYLLSVNSLSTNVEKNEQLKQSSIVQLELVNTALSDALATGVVSDPKLYQQSINVFSQAIMVMESLSLSTNINNFTQFTIKLNALIQQWITITTDNSINVNPSVTASLVSLNRLLWLDQRSIAKWRSHIRVSQEFIALARAHHQTLSSLTRSLPLVKLPSEEIWPEVLLPWLPPQIKTSVEAYYLALVSIFSLVILLILLLLYLVSLRIKRYQQHSMLLIEQRIKGNVTLPVVSLEQQQTLDLINQLAQPKHSENEYQNLKAKHDLQLAIISRHTRTLLWRTSQLSKESKLALREMLTLTTGQRWYHAFSSDVVKQILFDARNAKINNNLIECTIQDKQGRSFGLTIEFIDQCWQGTLSRQEHQAELKQELVLLNQTINVAEQSERLQQVEYSQKLSKMLIRTMLQSQNASLGYGVASLKVYRHLIRMLEWSKQLQLIAVLRAKNRQVQLTDVNFTNELYALVANVLVDANLQRNTVSYAVDSNIIAPCKLNIRLFHQTLSHFCQTLLKEQFKGHLHIAISMADKNSGQQILNFVFTITHLENSAILPEAIAALIQIDEQQLEKEGSLTRYFYRLLKTTYCEELHTKTIEQGYQITFKMPVTTAVSFKKPDDVVNLNQCNLLLLSNNVVTINTVDQLTKKHQAMLSTMGNMKHFTKQVSVKHLTKKAVAVVIIDGDVFSHDFDLIQQHINTLPKGLQPKVLVLQPLCNQAFHRVGMFRHTQRLLNLPTFAHTLKQFIKSDNTTNLLLSADIFKQYRFSATQVEVLFAVTEPEQHEVLLRLMHWMGLQVHLVSNQQQMLKKWKSGRYLILINEFDASPFIHLDVGKKVKRSLYTFSAAQQAQYRTNVAEDYRHWDLVQLPNVLDITTLIKAFNPWLKEQLPARTNKKLKPLEPAKVEALPASDAKITAVKFDEVAFDLALYAKNQGSSELAAFMLIDYINEIDTNIGQLIQSVTRKDNVNAKRALQEIQTIAKIMAANDLQQICVLLARLLAKQDFKGCNVVIVDLKIKYQLLAEYAEAI